jgi:phosphatidylinositol-3,4,5-trisphosphate 3-phosphatase and dual-specificity protein phosphatase PTEN
MDNVFRSLRQKVSADKNRYKQGDLDLDLTYITPRIIAMAYPAEGVESTFRNNIEHVARMLRTNHPNRYKLYNLSNRPYDVAKFDDSVCVHRSIDLDRDCT